MYSKIMVSFLFAALLTVVTGAAGIIALNSSGNKRLLTVIIIVTAVSLLLEILVARYISASMGLLYVFREGGKHALRWRHGRYPKSSR